MDRLGGKVAFITGAGAGIGRATAIGFAREGARVAVAEINPAAGDETAHLALRRAARAAQQCQRIHTRGQHRRGRADRGVLARHQARSVRHVPRLPVRHSRAIRAGGGSVINMSSNLALTGIVGRGCYTAAKGGIAGLTRSLAVEFAVQKVRVNAIAPSATMTDRVRKLMAGNEAIDRLARSHLIGLIEPADIANAAIYLASDESRMVTGQVLPVDSGVTIS